MQFNEIILNLRLHIYSNEKSYHTGTVFSFYLKNPSIAIWENLPTSLPHSCRLLYLISLRLQYYFALFLEFCKSLKAGDDIPKGNRVAGT